MSVAVAAPFSWPGAAWTLFARSAATTSPADSPRAISRSGSIQIRMASACPPEMSADPTPAMDVNRGWATRITKSVS